MHEIDVRIIAAIDHLSTIPALRITTVAITRQINASGFAVKELAVRRHLRAMEIRKIVREDGSNRFPSWARL